MPAMSCSNPERKGVACGKNFHVSFESEVMHFFNRETGESLPFKLRRVSKQIQDSVSPNRGIGVFTALRNAVGIFSF